MMTMVPKWRVRWILRDGMTFEVSISETHLANVLRTLATIDAGDVVEMNVDGCPVPAPTFGGILNATGKP